MQDLSPEMAKAVRRFEPIETEGLTLYPICVKDIDRFTVARPAIEFMQQSLPVALLSKFKRRTLDLRRRRDESRAGIWQNR